MVQSQFSLSWDSYKSSICNGFSALQQNGEFVDMTLAADGHFVKVHQVLVALASPYLKDLMTSAPCQHPVIFLNNVSYRNLCLLLEYIYTGEALVPAENLASFADAAKSLHIRGLEGINSNDNQSYKAGSNLSAQDDGELCQFTGRRVVSKSMPVSSTKLGTEGLILPASARKIHLKHEKDSVGQIKVGTVTSLSQKEEIHDYSDMMDDTGMQDDDDSFRLEDTPQTHADQDGTISKDKTISTNLLFTVSIRGSLQIILNRYIYNVNATNTKTGVRKWRCVEYRNSKCMAFVVTKGNVVLSRSNPHNHPFHDKKILAKIEKKSVFSALDDVEKYKEKADKLDDSDVSMEHDDKEILSLDVLGP